MEEKAEQGHPVISHPVGCYLERNDNRGEAYNHGKQNLRFTEWKAKLPGLNRHNDVKQQQSNSHPARSTVNSVTSAPSDA